MGTGNVMERSSEAREARHAAVRGANAGGLRGTWIDASDEYDHLCRRAVYLYSRVLDDHGRTRCWNDDDGGPGHSTD